MLIRTNICVLSCSFCDFAKKKGDDDAYEMTVDEILNNIDDEMHEVHMVGGHHPTWKFEYYIEIVNLFEKNIQIYILKVLLQLKLIIFIADGK